MYVMGITVELIFQIRWISQLNDWGSRRLPQLRSGRGQTSDWPNCWKCDQSVYLASIEIEHAKGVHEALFLTVLLDLLPGDVMTRTYLEFPIVKASQALWFCGSVCSFYDYLSSEKGRNHNLRYHDESGILVIALFSTKTQNDLNNFIYNINFFNPFILKYCLPVIYRVL